MKNNLLTAILSELKVNFTRQFANKLYSETPDKENFFGLAYMLSMYGVKAKGYYVQSKRLEEIQMPFVAQTLPGFMMVVSINNNALDCVDERGHHKISLEAFLDSWTGNALVVEKQADFGELDYFIHKQNENKNRCKSVIIYTSLVIIVFGGVLSQVSSMTYSMLIYLVLCIIGLGVSAILLDRQWYPEIHRGEKICDLFGKGGCETIANSPASRALFGISWSEVGFGYFLSTFILFILIPQIKIILGVIGIFALPYTFWSLWYQAIKLRKGCPLCVAVQVILWGMVVTFSYFAHCPYYFVPVHLLSIPFYCVVILSVHFYSLEKEKGIRQAEIINSFRSALCRRNVLFELQKNVHLISVTNDDSRIMLGNPQASNKITIVSNPLCGPCAFAHKVLERVLGGNEDIQVRYIFVSHNEDTKFASLYLIQSFCKFGGSFFGEWFNMTIQERRNLMSLLKGMEIKADAEEELQCHKSFYERNGFRQTPTILINGRIVPSIYSIEDLAYTLFE